MHDKIEMCMDAVRHLANFWRGLRWTFLLFFGFFSTILFAVCVTFWVWPAWLPVALLGLARCGLALGVIVGACYAWDVRKDP